jgi:hypothetical protein
MLMEKSGGSEVVMEKSVERSALMSGEILRIELFTSSESCASSLYVDRET